MVRLHWLARAALAWALIILQVALVGLNIRGVRNNDPAVTEPSASASSQVAEP